ncbi:hypothetical protein [Flavobacterium algicola]|uniref:hypothetical protein n=1 Tax=Flavobacterium algicola TaxID=556529 RepID=UPI001EFC30FB|nr:hypothetical protein [Flavobacterium algicola]MCG9791207.1 hypothetical protein [Flavobacterium algicola]
MNRLLFIFTIMVLISCSNKKSNTDNLEGGKTATYQTLETKNKPFDKTKSEYSLGNYIGKIGKNLNVSFHLDNYDGKVLGFYYYKEKGIDISIRGRLKENNLVVYELDYKNDTTAVIKGSTDKYGIKGIWINFKSKKEYPLILEKKDIKITRLPKNIIGEYHNDICNLTLSITKLKGEYFYNYNSTERNLKGKVTFLREEDLYINLSEIEFAEDYFDISLPEEDLEKSKKYEELKKVGKRYIGVECYYSPEELTIQNYGNAMNYYVKLSDCGEKYIRFKKQ